MDSTTVQQFDPDVLGLRYRTKIETRYR
ncbi:hypothetical protein ACOJIV_28090 [Haloarcula sp. AONF1]